MFSMFILLKKLLRFVGCVLMLIQSMSCLLVILAMLSWRTLVSCKRLRKKLLEGMNSSVRS